MVSKTQPLLTISIPLSSADSKGGRVDKVLISLKDPQIPSRSQLKAWFDAGLVRIGDRILKPGDRVSGGERIVIAVPTPSLPDLHPIAMDLKVFFEDEDLVVLYKPRGLSMHPGAQKKFTPTLVHGLLASGSPLSTRGEQFRPGIVHRLDKDTEGIVVVAKNNKAHEGLSKQFSDRSIERNYWALVAGQFPNEMTIEAPIGRDPRNRKKMAVNAKGRPAKTYVKRLAVQEGGFSLVDCKLFTGRTHQIRVHLAHQGFPILNDPLYARPKKLNLTSDQLQVLKNLKGQALVAYRLGFIHPRTQTFQKFEVNYPEWLKALLS